MKIFIEEQLKYLQTKEIYERNLYHRKLDELIRTKNIVIIE
jgi:hypothetical protein